MPTRSLRCLLVATLVSGCFSTSDFDVDEETPPAASGVATAGAAGKQAAGSGGTTGGGQETNGGSAGVAGHPQAGTGGAATSGAGGNPQNGSGGNPQSGSGGNAQSGTGGKASGGAPGAGAGGSAKAGAAGAAQAGKGGAAGQSGGPLPVGSPCAPGEAGDALCAGKEKGTETVCSAQGACVHGCHVAALHCPKSAPFCTKSECTATAPVGTPCAGGNDDVTCNLGLPGSEMVCSTSSKSCIAGCHSDFDCPSARPTCSMGSLPWSCK